MRIVRLMIFTAIMSLSILGNSQELTQSIRGRIIDADSEVPAIGASVVVIDSDPFIGAATDVDGYFKLTNVPIGRVMLKITYIGYEEKIIPNILVTSAKEVFLTVTVTESLNQLETFEIVGNGKRDEPIDEMAIISSRTFSTEETKRYAGTLNDPARMASNFAGVSSNAEGSNDIVV
ncbi:MAG: carboxypeptidase-like regulatory domain-containing protein, partial [Flavobacteriales bacterium]|nr:carboxypeptidase-like regulatory domain-containing protein [Flavobacteriales bacterium]